MMNWSRFLAVARAEAPADLVVTGGRVLNVFSGEVESIDFSICDGRIAGMGSGLDGATRIELDGAFVAPGLIDAHVHIESSLCLPAEFASAVVPRGVTTAVIDPHEIANVLGAAGVRFMAAASQGVPMNVVVMAPSCVPATSMATAGAALDASDLEKLRQEGLVHGLAEAMDFPGVLGNASAMRAKLDAFGGRPIDGHCPGLSGHALNAYVAAGVGSDHECVTVEEAREKLARGLYLLIREATNAQNLDALLPLINTSNSRRICFCSDDRTPSDLLRSGSIDDMVRRAIAYGIAPIEAIRMATLNTAEWFGLSHLGAVSPGKQADFFVFDELETPTAKQVYHQGQPIESTQSFASSTATLPPTSRCDIDIHALSLKIPASGKCIRVIGSIPDQLLTEHLKLEAKVRDGLVVADVSRDILKIAVLERHRGSGNVGLGFIRGFGLQSGAIAGTVAHDHHNLIAIGADDESMRQAIRTVADMSGGLCCCDASGVLAQLPMPVAGLMSDRPIAEVAAAYDRLVEAARQLGSSLADPFMAMGFMGLEVIPSLKITDLGLVDVDAFTVVPLFVD